MATATRSTTAPPKRETLPVKRSNDVVLSLPTTKSVVENDLNKYSFLIHGEKKIGKTTLLTVEDNVLLLTCDPLQKALSILQRHIPDWRHFMTYLDMLEKAAASGKYPYLRVVVDGADIWHRMCQTWCEKHLVEEYIGDAPYGKGWSLLKNTFDGAIRRLLKLPGGCNFISHSKWAEGETRDGKSIEKLTPLMSATGEEILVGLIDGWFAYDYSGKERVLVVRGDERTAAGHRIRGHFNTPKGRQVHEIPMGESEFEAWDNFKAAFHNKQWFTTLAERDRKLAAQKKGGAATTKPNAPKK